MAKLVRHLTDVFRHLEWPCVTWPQLTLRTRLQRERRAVEAAQLHLVTHHKLQVVMMVIVVALGILLSLEQAIPNLGEEVVTVV